MHVSTLHVQYVLPPIEQQPSTAAAVPLLAVNTVAAPSGPRAYVITMYMPTACLSSPPYCPLGVTVLVHALQSNLTPALLHARVNTPLTPGSVSLQRSVGTP